jgi:hypothetical protein
LLVTPRNPRLSAGRGAHDEDSPRSRRGIHTGPRDQRGSTDDRLAPRRRRPAHGGERRALEEGPATAPDNRLPESCLIIGVPAPASTWKPPTTRSRNRRQLALRAGIALRGSLARHEGERRPQRTAGRLVFEQAQPAVALEITRVVDISTRWEEPVNGRPSRRHHLVAALVDERRAHARCGLALRCALHDRRPNARRRAADRVPLERFGPSAAAFARASPAGRRHRL